MNVKEYFIDLARRQGLKGTDEAILNFAKTIIKNHFTMADVKYIEEHP